MTETRLRFGFSPCPNDTFMVCALVHGDVEVAGARIDPVVEDVEELNRRAVEGHDPLEITKLSAAVLPLVEHRYRVLPAGAAIGRGCGPLVVVEDSPAAPRCLADLEGTRIAIPGVHTTAWLLLRLLGPAAVHAVPMRFDEIMPAVARGEAEAGLVIHESRFTYREHGLAAIADLGELWETDTGLPLPLGVIAAARSLGRERVAAIARALRRSVAFARTHPRRVWGYVRSHAQELSDDVCRAHVDLYVNDLSVDAGREGLAAISELIRRARERGISAR